MSVLALRDVSYQYRNATRETLSHVNYSFERGTFYALLGKSGAGKSTLLSLLAGLDTPSSGAILFEDEPLNAQRLHTHRRDHIALVFQNYNLIDYLTPLENIRLVNKHANADILLDLGLEEQHSSRNVLKLSGGQQQRVAIARALASKAPVILADEPTGNLDEQTALDIMHILKERAATSNKCVIVVTHSTKLAKMADVVVELRNKQLCECEPCECSSSKRSHVTRSTSEPTPCDRPTHDEASSRQRL